MHSHLMHALLNHFQAKLFHETTPAKIFVIGCNLACLQFPTWSPTFLVISTIIWLYEVN